MKTLRGPEAHHNLIYTQPALTWDEALPLGNGLLGGLFWGDGNPLRLSLDRADLWDLRPIPEFDTPEYSYTQLESWWRAGNHAAITQLYDETYFRPAPTKLPAGRIEFIWPNSPTFQEMLLDLRTAEATCEFANGLTIAACVHATEPVGLMKFRNLPTPGDLPIPKLMAPAFHGEARENVHQDGDYGDLAGLGYPAAVPFSEDCAIAFVQSGHADFRFAVYVAWRIENAGCRLAWSLATSQEAGDPLALARERVIAALDKNWDGLHASHREWWSQFWSQSSLELSNARLEKQWVLEQYKFGSASRRGAPPICLQGPWTADDGKLPPWKGDFHHDLNTQLSYWPCYAADHLEEGLAYLDWLWKIRPVCREWTRRFFGVPGLNVPGVCTLEGVAMGGWAQYSFSGTISAWLSHHFYLHWKYSGDETFLRERAYPYLNEVATFLENLTRPIEPGNPRSLRLSSSPEFHNYHKLRLGAHSLAVCRCRRDGRCFGSS